MVETAVLYFFHEKFATGKASEPETAGVCVWNYLCYLAMLLKKESGF